LLVGLLGGREALGKRAARTGVEAEGSAATESATTTARSGTRDRGGGGAQLFGDDSLNTRPFSRLLGCCQDGAFTDVEIV